VFNGRVSPIPRPTLTGTLLTGLLFESSEPNASRWGIAMAICKWALLFFVVSITASLSGVANRSSVVADVAGALSDAFLIILAVLLVLGFTVYRPTVARWPRRVRMPDESQLSALGIRPLPPHSLHGDGYTLRPDCTGCFAAGNPVPTQAGHLCSVGFAGGFFIRTLHARA
jgi:uncharacterized membrane protein YtjA (UPF0391 family)